MKRMFIIFCMTSILLGGCADSGVSKEEYERVVEEKDAIYAKYNSLIADYAKLENELKSMKESEGENAESETEEISAETTELKENELVFSYDNMDVKFQEFKIEKNSAGDKCLVLYFDFTNNTDENQTFIYSFSVNAFQNGIALDSSMVHVNEETKNHGREIQPGTTITVASAFLLTDEIGIIDVEIEPWVSLKEEKLLEFEVDLEKQTE